MKSWSIDFQTDKKSGWFKTTDDRTPLATRNTTETRQGGSKPSHMEVPASFGGIKPSGRHIEVVDLSPAMKEKVDGVGQLQKGRTRRKGHTVRRWKTWLPGLVWKEESHRPCCKGMSVWLPHWREVREPNFFEVPRGSSTSCRSMISLD